MANLQDMLPQPDDRNVPVWRYMDLAKFIWMLQRESLYFARADDLGDPFEGAISSPTIELFEKSSATSADENNKIPAIAKSNVIDALKGQRLWMIPTMFISCWHASEHESAAMWSQYSKSNESIALKTSYSKLRDALPSCITTGTVHYMDYDREAMPTENVFYPFMRKRLSFAHEREIRAIAWSIGDDCKDEQRLVFGDRGATLSINLSDLIEAVHVSPTAPEWFVEVVSKLVGAAKISAPVLQSALAARPLY